MIIVSHRRNTSELLASTDQSLGVEVDIRSWGERLIVQHDPFTDGEDFEDWCRHYAHRLLILNVKEEGLEDRLLRLMKARGVEEFFFLDQSFPFLIRTARAGEKRCAVRVSEFEIDRDSRNARGAGLVGLARLLHPLSDQRRRGAAPEVLGFRLCLVSPELQGRPGDQAIPELRELLSREGVEADAVCTKLPDLWREARA